VCVEAQRLAAWGSAGHSTHLHLVNVCRECHGTLVIQGNKLGRMPGGKTADTQALKRTR
jgi:hypothetical protein